MADIKLDLLGLKYSQNFSIAGLEEANIDLSLSPAAEIFFNFNRYSNRWSKSYT